VTAGTDTESTLGKYRAELDTIDEQLLALLGKRYALCREVAKRKRANDIPLMQPARIKEVKERAADIGVQHSLDPLFVLELYALIIGEACRLEDEIISGAPD
jgi:chorismate mutase